MKNFRLLIIFPLFVLFSSSILAQPGSVLIQHNFDASNDGWVPDGSVGGMIFKWAADPFLTGIGNVWVNEPFNNYGSSDGAYVTSPSLDMTDYTVMTLTMDVRHNTEKNWDGMNMYYSTDDFASQTLLGSEGSGFYNTTATIDGLNDRFAEITSDPEGWSGDNFAWQPLVVALPGALEGQPNVKFRVYFGTDGSVTDDGAAFDNVIIIGTLAAPSCAAPTVPTSSAITTTTATISWTAASPAPAVGYDYYYSTSSTSPDVLTTPSGSVPLVELEGHLTGLVPGVTYYYWIRSDCGGDLSDWTSSSNFACTALPPTVTSFTPTSGCTNETVIVITGTGFGGATAVTIGGVNVSSFTVDSETQITATVGLGNTGFVRVWNPAGNDQNATTFTFDPNATVTTQPAVTLDILTGNSDIISVVSGDAVSYQWQYSVNNVLWSVVADGTPANVTYSGSTTANLTVTPSLDVVAATVFYRCNMSCGSVTSNSSQVTFVQYCAASGSNLDGISGVVFNGIDNQGSGLDVYTDYSSTIQTTVYRDSSYDLSVYVNTGGGYTNYQKVWFDWNANGDFTDAGEEYDLGTAFNVSNGLSSSCPLGITIPSDATEGNVKMRVLSRYGQAGSSCLTSFDGEVEDYAIYIRYPYVWQGSISTEWEDKDNWTLGATPVYTSLIVVPDVGNQPVITSAVLVEELRISSSADLTVSSNSLSVSTSVDNNGTLNIGNATVSVDGPFDGTSGTIDMTDASANLVVSSTVTSLGALDESLGTVTYNAVQQSILLDSYFNLSISTAGTKTALGNLDVNGDLTTAATAYCKLDMDAYQLNVGGNLTVGSGNGLDLSDASSSLTLDGTADQTVTHAGNTLITPGATVSEGFESGSGSWVADNSTSFDWKRDASGTPSSGTGPIVGANGSTWYYYTEASSGSTGNDDYLTQTFDFSTYIAPQISFYYHMYGASMGTLYLEVNTGGGWSSLFSLSGQQQGSNGADWIQQAVDLSAYGLNASCQIRFHGERGTSWTGDIAIDDIEISDNGGGGSEYEFPALTISKASGNVILGSTVLMDGALTLTSGYIDASSFDLQLTSNATVSGGSDASHVIGTVVKTTESTASFTFPLGDGTYYKAISVMPSAVTSNVWTAQYFNTVHPNSVMETVALDHVSAYEYWDLDNGAGLSGKVMIPWVSQNAVLEYADLRIAHYDGSTDWDMVASTPLGNNTSGAIVSDTWVTDYSPFTIGSTSATNVLPITLVSFSGEKKENKNILNWTTASEINNAFFTIEKSYNGLDFDWVGTQEGSSPSTQIINYSLTDYNILERINYYRLKQTDFDGKFVYSNTISIDNRNDYSFKEIIGKTNLLGQEVDENYNGIVIVQYKDGTSRKYYQFK
jgi:hypothetical protein